MTKKCIVRCLKYGIAYFSYTYLLEIRVADTPYTSNHKYNTG